MQMATIIDSDIPRAIVAALVTILTRAIGSFTIGTSALFSRKSFQV